MTTTPTTQREADERKLLGFDIDDLSAIADGLESGYEKSIDVGGSPLDGKGPNLIASTTAVAARFIRAAIGQSTGQVDATQEALEESFACLLAERTNLSTDGIDEYVPRIVGLLRDFLPFEIVPTEGIDPSYYAMPSAAAKVDHDEALLLAERAGFINMSGFIMPPRATGHITPEVVELVRVAAGRASLTPTAPRDGALSHIERLSQATTRSYDPVYQVWLGNKGAWLDTDKAHYDEHAQERRRIMHTPTAPQAASQQAETCTGPSTGRRWVKIPPYLAPQAATTASADPLDEVVSMTRRQYQADRNECFRLGEIEGRESAGTTASASIDDDPEFQRLAEYWRGEPLGTRSFLNAWDEMVAYIDLRAALACAPLPAQAGMPAIEFAPDADDESCARRMKNFSVRAEPAREPDFVGEKLILVTYNGRQEYTTALAPHEARRFYDLLAVEYGFAAPVQAVDVARDAARLDWIDQRIADKGSVWILPSGAEMQFVQLRHAGHTTNYPTVPGKVREAIDAAMSDDAKEPK